MRFRQLLFLCTLFCITFSAFSQSRFQDPNTKKWGYHDDEWNIIIPAIYDEVQPHFDTIIAVKKDGLMAALDDKGNYRIPLIYELIMPNLSPFRSQFGYAAVTKNSKIRNSWGMVDAHGKVLLPLRFQYVRAITPDLLVGRVDGDSVLQFFNAVGNLLYKIAGKKVKPSRIDNSSFGVDCLDHKTRFYKLDGSFVFPSDPRSGIWTNGNLVIRWRDNKMGMIDQFGKVLLPFEFATIHPGFEGQFIASREINNIQSGVFDKAGKVVVPVGEHIIYAMDGAYAVTDMQTEKRGIYSKTGAEILPPKYQMSRPYISSEYGKIPDSHPERYLVVQDRERNLAGLYKTDGTVIVPIKYAGVQYFSEQHPILVELPATSENDLPRKTALDFQGNTLLPQTYARLAITANPRILIASMDLLSKNNNGFINLDAPEKNAMNMSYPARLGNGYYRVQDGRNYQLFSPEAVLIHSGTFNWLRGPEKKHYEQFRSSENGSGRLVAIGFREGMKYGDWIGLNSAGKEFIFVSQE